MNDHMKDLGDVAAGGTALGTLLAYLPEMAALFTIIWTSIRIYEWARSRLRKQGDGSNVTLLK